VSVSVDKMTMSTNSNPCAVSMIVRLGNLSARVPASGVSSRIGRNIIVVSQPSAVASPCVSTSRTIHAWAVRVIHSPRFDATLPMKKWR